MNTTEVTTNKIAQAFTLLANALKNPHFKKAWSEALLSQYGTNVYLELFEDIQPPAWVVEPAFMRLPSNEEVLCHKVFSNKTLCEILLSHLVENDQLPNTDTCYGVRTSVISNNETGFLIEIQVGKPVPR